MTDQNERAERVSLREALGGDPDPDFTLVLPPGWERRAVTDAEQERMLGEMRGRLLTAQRPELYARMRQLTADAFTQMRKVSAVAMFLPVGEEALYLPASITASILHAETGTNLDAQVRTMIARDGATPLLGDKRILRAERRSTQSVDGETAAVTTIVHLTPVPGSERRRALQLTSVIVHPQDAPADDPPLVAMKALFDMCATTLSWLPAAPAPSTSSR